MNWNFLLADNCTKVVLNPLKFLGMMVLLCPYGVYSQQVHKINVNMYFCKSIRYYGRSFYN